MASPGIPFFFRQFNIWAWQDLTMIRVYSTFEKNHMYTLGRFALPLSFNSLLAAGTAVIA